MIDHTFGFLYDNDFKIQYLINQSHACGISLKNIYIKNIGFLKVLIIIF